MCLLNVQKRVIISQPYIKQQTLGKVIGKTSRTTLTKYINEMVTAQIIVPKKEGKEIYYINSDLTRILEG
jgi:Fic family protein